MKAHIDAVIGELVDKDYRFVFVDFPREAAMRMLGIMYGLLSGRIEKLTVQGKDSKIIISVKDMCMTICLPDRRFEEKLTKNELECIAACCFDVAFDQFPGAHVDLEFADIDFTLQWAE